MMRRPPNTLRSIGLPVIPNNPSANVWNTTHDLPMTGSFELSGNTDSLTYNGYNMVPPYLGVVNNTSTSFAQQQLPMNNVTAMGVPMHNYSSQTIPS